MTRRTILTLVTVALMLTLVPQAYAHWPSTLGRHLGVGWSDGYHAQNDCPPGHSRNLPYSSWEVPWWTFPAPQTRPPPALAAPHARSGRPTGPSLFREPGEGASVVTTVQP